MPKIKETTKRRKSKKIERKEKLKKEKPVKKTEIITPKPEKYLETVEKGKPRWLEFEFLPDPLASTPRKHF